MEDRVEPLDLALQLADVLTVEPQKAHFLAHLELEAAVVDVLLRPIELQRFTAAAISRVASCSANGPCVGCEPAMCWRKNLASRAAPSRRIRRGSKYSSRTARATVVTRSGSAASSTGCAQRIRSFRRRFVALIASC